MNVSAWILGALAFFVFRLMGRIDDLEKEAERQSGELKAIHGILERVHKDLVDENG